MHALGRRDGPPVPSRATGAAPGRVPRPHSPGTSWSPPPGRDGKTSSCASARGARGENSVWAARWEAGPWGGRGVEAGREQAQAACMGPRGGREGRARSGSGCARARHARRRQKVRRPRTTQQQSCLRLCQRPLHPSPRFSPAWPLPRVRACAPANAPSLPAMPVHHARWGRFVLAWTQERAARGAPLPPVGGVHVRAQGVRHRRATPALTTAANDGGARQLGALGERPLIALHPHRPPTRQQQQGETPREQGALGWQWGRGRASWGTRGGYKHALGCAARAAARVGGGKGPGCVFCGVEGGGALGKRISRSR